MLEQIQQYVDPYYLAALLTLSYTFRDLGLDLAKKIHTKARRVEVVIVIAALLALPFYFNNPCEDCLIKLLLTYCVGTSTYETFLKYFESFIASLFKSKVNGK